MGINFDTALGIHQHTVKLRAQRSEILANNLANADTPRFKAKDVDFKDMLSQIGNSETSLRTTNKHHMGGHGSNADFDLKYRVPTQPSMDGNTVDEQMETSKFTENSLRYLASLRFLDGKFKGLMTAIRGE